MPKAFGRVARGFNSSSADSSVEVETTIRSQRQTMNRPQEPTVLSPLTLGGELKTSGPIIRDTIEQAGVRRGFLVKFQQ